MGPVLVFVLGGLDRARNDLQLWTSAERQQGVHNSVKFRCTGVQI